MGKTLLKYSFIKRQFSWAILSATFKKLDFLDNCDLWSEWLRKCISQINFSCKIKSLKIEFEFCEQTREECKWGSNVAW